MLRSALVLLLAFVPGCSIYVGGRGVDSSHSVAVAGAEQSCPAPRQSAHPYPAPATAAQPPSAPTTHVVDAPATPARTAATPRTRPRASSRPDRPIDRVVGTRGNLEPRSDLIPVASGGSAPTSTPTPSTSTPTPSTSTPTPSTSTPTPGNPTTRPTTTRPNPNVWSRSDRDLRVSAQRREIKPLTRVCATCPERAVATPSDRVRPALQR